MALLPVPNRHVDSAAHRQRLAETVNGITSFQFDDSRVRTQGEIDNGVTPVNFAYRPGSFQRYGMDPTGVTPCDTAFANACKANTVVFDDHPEGGLYTFATGVAPTRYPLRILGAALSYGSTTGTRFNLQAAAGAGAATLHFTGAMYGLRIERISFNHESGTLGQAGIKADNELRAGHIADCYFVTAEQGSGNSTLGIWMVGGGTFSGSFAIKGCNFANLAYPIFLAGSITTLRIVRNEIIGSTAALASNGITIGDNCSGISIYGNSLEGFNSAGSRGIYSAGTRVMQGHNRFETCEHAFEWIRGSTGTIKSRSGNNVFVTTGAPIYPRNTTDLCAVTDEAVFTVDDCFVDSLQGFIEGGRAKRLGEYYDLTGANFNAGNYTANGSLTWTVATGQTSVHRASVVRNTMTMEWAITGSTAGGVTNSALRLLIPGSFTAKVTGAFGMRCPCIIQNNNVFGYGMVLVQNGLSYVEIYIDPIGGSNWTLSANTGTHGSITFEVN